MKLKLLSLPISLLLASPAMAGQFIWTGATDTAWTNAANWDVATVAPVSPDTYPHYGSTYPSDFLVIKNNGDLLPPTLGNTPGFGAVYDPGAGVTTTFSGGRCFVVGIGTPGTNGSASLEVRSGTIAAVRTNNVGSEPYMANRTNTLLLINGGAVDLTGSPNNFRLIQEGQLGITSTLTITTGSFSSSLLDLLYDTEADPATVYGDGIINLDGGFLAVNRFNRSASASPGQSSSTINFNGGILRARNTNPNFLPDLPDTRAIVKAGGAKIDTLGFTSTIAAVLEHDSSLGAAPDGGLTKTGTGSLILSGANTYTGATTGESGNIFPKTDTAFGTGPVVMNADTLYATGGSYTIANALTLNTGTLLRVGGGNNNLLTWTGPVTVRGTAGISSDGGTSGIALSNTLDIAGATFTSFGNGSVNFVSGAITGAGGNVTVTGGTLVLSGANDYSGQTTISAGTLTLGADNVLPEIPNQSTITIADGTLNAATRSDTAGPLGITAAATINLGPGAALAFANSSAVTWAGGTLQLTGTFVSGSSLRFGTSAGGLTTGQLAQISAEGFSTFALDDAGFLTATATGGYNTFAGVNAPTGTPGDDFDNDGVSNGAEYVLGGTKATNDAGKLPNVSVMGGNLIFTFQRAQSSIDTTTAVTVETGTDLVTWPGSYPVPATAATNDPGITVTKDTSPGFDTVTLTVPQGTAPRKFARLVVKP